MLDYKSAYQVLLNKLPGYHATRFCDTGNAFGFPLIENGEDAGWGTVAVIDKQTGAITKENELDFMLNALDEEYPCYRFDELE